MGPRGLVWSLAGLAEVAAVQGQPERAARLFGAADAIRGRTGRGRPPSQDAAVCSLRELMGPDRYDAAWAEGQALPTEQAVEEALRGMGLSPARHDGDRVAPYSNSDC